MKKIDYKKQGKKNKKKGIEFEKQVRDDLEKRGFCVVKYHNNVDLKEKKIIPAKSKFNPFKKILQMSSGFPDFLCYRYFPYFKSYEIYGVEARSSGYLSAEEKQKCRFLLENNIFAYILIAKKSKDKKIHYFLFNPDKKIQKTLKKQQNPVVFTTSFERV